MISSAVTFSCADKMGGCRTDMGTTELTWVLMSKSASKFSHVYECLKAFCSYLRFFLTALKGMES